ncbi:uncharacterized protein G2W53_027139 [Senna tora]|uniref:Uncharacterized protein n=1 Tax=Senna tora TaxID=362788 RepID=A0A834TQ93_9FABA|nr:uncharacterized protein G2W53_027139 [Senna tora]
MGMFQSLSYPLTITTTYDTHRPPPLFWVVRDNHGSILKRSTIFVEWVENVKMRSSVFLPIGITNQTVSTYFYEGKSQV